MQNLGDLILSFKSNHKRISEMTDVTKIIKILTLYLMHE